INNMALHFRSVGGSHLVTEMVTNFVLPDHLPTHLYIGGQPPTQLAGSKACAVLVHIADAVMAGTPSRVFMSVLVAATDNTARETGLDLVHVSEMEPYWESVREIYAPFESGLPAPTGRIYAHEIPGGQLSNLRQQAIALGLGERFEDI